MKEGFIDLDKVNVAQKKEEMTVPLAYIPIKLTAGGKLGVPETVHCRNFNTEDILTLSMLADSIMPERMIAVLNSILYEKVNVAEWPDKCIVELLVLVYVNFFTPLLPQVAFPWNQDDVDWLKSHGDASKVEALEKGMWVPRMDLDLRTLNLKKLSSAIKDTITIRKKDDKGATVFSARFLSYPRYGDSLVLRQLVLDKFGDREKKYNSIEMLFDSYSKYYEEGRDASTLPPLDTQLYLEWQSFLLEKNVFLADATMALYLQEFKGTDVSTLSIQDKIPYVKDPQFDITITNKLNKHYGSLDFGIDPDVEVLNPITNEKCTRRFQFRFNDILQAIRAFDADGYDISYD